MENTERDAQVLTQVTDLERAISEVNDIVSQLAERLSSVLRHEPQEPTEVDKEPQVLVPLAEDLLKIINRINNQYSRIASILTRLEL